jgi:Flp pilus assembly protein TadG
MRQHRLAVWLLADRGGAAAIEFALVFPVLCAFILGIWYTGWAIQEGGEVRHAVELASRIYITNPSSTSAQLSTAVSTHLQTVPIGSVTLSTSSQTVDSASYQHITWSYQATAPIPGMPTVGYNFTGAVDVPAATP